MAVHAVSVWVAVIQFVSYVILSTCVQYAYYYRRADEPEAWKSQPSKLRLVSVTSAARPRTAAVAPLSVPTPTVLPAPNAHDSTHRGKANLSLDPSITFSVIARPSPAPASLSRRLLLSWMYPPKWLLFPSLPRVADRHPHHAIITLTNLTISSCMAGCVTEAFMRGRSALTTHQHLLPALATPTAFFPTADRPSLPHVLCTLLLSILWQCVCEYYWHRMQHLPFFYRHMHKLHHYYKAPQPFDDLMIHPLEAAGYYCILFSPAFLIPQSVLSFLLYMAVLGVCGVLDHCGVDIRVLGVYDTREHDEHHRLFNCNYSFPFPFMDQLHGTYKAPAAPSMRPRSEVALVDKTPS